MGKYDFFDLDPYSVHQKIVKFVGEQKKVLDIGCAEGNLSKQMKINKCEVFGIEIDVESAKVAEKYCKDIFIGNVESIKLQEEYENYFDFIIFADVLEHLKEPSRVLKRFEKYLKEDGYIIVSLPNIANWRMRLKLLTGHFEYEDHGLLDNGHLKFFNEKSAKRLLLDSGFEIVKFDITVGNLKRFAKFFYSIGSMWPNLLAFQFLIIANKKQ